MIRIKKPTVEENGEITSVKLPMEIDGKSDVVNFNFSSEYTKYLTIDRADAFFVLFCYYAMQNNHELNFDMPISERLMYQMKYYWMDAIAKEDNDFHNVKVSCETTNDVYDSANAVGTGISCGVDSLTAIYTHNYKYNLEHYKVTHLVFSDMGAYNYGDGSRVTNKNGEDYYTAQKKNSIDFANEIGLPVLVFESDYADKFPCAHNLVDAMRNCFVPLMFQKLFSVYYYASTYKLNEFHLSPKVNSGFYELFTLGCISTNNIMFYSANASYTRMQKTREIVDFDLAQKHLMVCSREDTNCGSCRKCTQTLLSLNVLKALPKFTETFDIPKFKREKSKLIGYALASKHDGYYGEILDELKKVEKIPVKSVAYGLAFKAVKPIQHQLQKIPYEKKKKMIAFSQKHNINIPF